MIIQLLVIFTKILKNNLVDLQNGAVKVTDAKRLTLSHQSQMAHCHLLCQCRP